jgi:hypothetical protein
MRLLVCVRAVHIYERNVNHDELGLKYMMIITKSLIILAAENLRVTVDQQYSRNLMRYNPGTAEQQGPSASENLWGDDPVPSRRSTPNWDASGPLR